MPINVTELLTTLGGADDPSERLASALPSIASASSDELATLMSGLCQIARDKPECRLAGWWSSVLVAVHTWWEEREAGSAELDSPLREATVQLYRDLGPPNTVRHTLLALLARTGGPAELAAFSALMTSDPPRQSAAVGAAFAPLFRAPAVALHGLFPRLWDALSNPEVASLALDLANHLTRQQPALAHPASDRTAELVRLLQALACELEALQDDIVDGTRSPREMHARAAEGIPLAISLCDALGLIGDTTARSALANLLHLKHRRLRVEAAAALARLKDQEGTLVLADMAAEAAVRLRVLAYADELDLAEQIDPRFRLPLAVAEAELVTFLAAPSQMGLPPTSCQLTDSQTLYWPGYEEPRQCFLFRFTYCARQPDDSISSYTNVGIAGPLSYAFSADVTDLCAADIYAAFAGWHAEHAEIRELELHSQSAQTAYVAAVGSCEKRLREGGYEGLQALFGGLFFGDRLIIFSCSKNGRPGTAIVDAESIYWFPCGLAHRPRGPEVAYCIYKGRRLLAAFND